MNPDMWFWATMVVLFALVVPFLAGVIEAHREAQASARRAKRSRVFRKAMHHE